LPHADVFAAMPAPPPPYFHFITVDMPHAAIAIDSPLLFARLLPQILPLSRLRRHFTRHFISLMPLFFFFFFLP